MNRMPQPCLVLPSCVGYGARNVYAPISATIILGNSKTGKGDSAIRILLDVINSTCAFPGTSWENGFREIGPFINTD